MQAFVLLIQAVLVAGVAAWMIVAVRDNWLHPDLNLEGIAMVMRFDKMAAEYPDDYAHLAHRRVDDARLHRLAFLRLQRKDPALDPRGDEFFCR